MTPNEMLSILELQKLIESKNQPSLPIRQRLAAIREQNMEPFLPDEIRIPYEEDEESKGVSKKVREEVKAHFLRLPDREQELYSLLAEGLDDLKSADNFPDKKDLRLESPRHIEAMKKLITKMQKQVAKHALMATRIPSVEEFSTVTNLISQIFFHYGIGGVGAADLSESPAIGIFVDDDLRWLGFPETSKEKQKQTPRATKTSRKETAEESLSQQSLNTEIVDLVKELSQDKLNHLWQNLQSQMEHLFIQRGPVPALPPETPAERKERLARQESSVEAYEKRAELVKRLQRQLSGAKGTDRENLLEAVLAIMARKRGIFSLLTQDEKRKWFEKALHRLIPNAKQYYEQHKQQESFSPPNPLTQSLYDVETLRLS